VAKPDELDEAIEAVFRARFGTGVRAANEAAAAEHLARRFDTGPELSQNLWGAGTQQREQIIEYLRGQYRVGASIGESPNFPKNRVLSQLRAWYETGPSEGMRGDPTYVARRIAITESAFYMQALDNAVDEKLEAAGMIDGYEILLAPEREDWDCRCPEHAAGGPYPTLDETPEPPFHPLCMCRRRPIILGEKTKELRESERRAKAELARLVAGATVQFTVPAIGWAAEQLLRQYLNLQLIITRTDEGLLLRQMTARLLQHHILLGRERVRMMFGRGPRKPGTAAWPMQGTGITTPALEESARAMTALAEQAHKQYPALPAPKPMPKGWSPPTPAEYDASVRDLLREAMREAKPYRGFATYRPTDAAFKRWADDDVIRSLFEKPAGSPIRVGPIDLTVWQKGGKLKPTVLGKKPDVPGVAGAQPKPPKPPGSSAAAGKPVLFRVWPISAVAISDLPKPTGEGVLDDLQWQGSEEIVFPPGTTLRPFALTEEDGEYVIDFREMPSWDAPAEYPDEEILRYVPPALPFVSMRGLAVTDESTVAAWRTLFPIAPDQVIEHLMFGIDAKVDAISITASPIGDIVIELHTDKFTSRRRFAPGVNGVEVTHTSLNVKPEFQGQGIGRAFLTNSVYLYEALGYRGISTYASVSDSDIGGYTWARFGFKPLQYEWDRIRRENLQPWLDTHRVGIGPDAAAMLADVIADDDPAAIWRLAQHRLGLAIITGARAGSTSPTPRPCSSSTPTCSACRW
jgi:GNAT superfamily N-acetyltransferase